MRYTEEYLKQLRDFLEYDSNIGELIWKQDYSKFKKGTVAGSINGQGYRMVSFNKLSTGAHRIIWFLIYGSFPDGIVDHINRKRKDNRLENLRNISVGENNQNIDVMSRVGLGRLVGASFCKTKNKWQAKIRLNYKTTFIGYFDTEEEAHNAYLAKKREIHTASNI